MNHPVDSRPVKAETEKIQASGGITIDGALGQQGWRRVPAVNGYFDAGPCRFPR
jgi:hypothetical protein